MHAEVAARAVAAAGPLLERPLLGKPPRPAQIAEKAAHDYWTELDVAIEHAVAAVVHAAFPGHAVWGEEVFTDVDPAAEDIWYLDPIDGTRNLVAGRPDVAVSLAWYHRGSPRAAAMWLPCRDLTLVAEADVPGMRVNGELFEAPPAPSPDRALVGMAGDFRAPGDAAVFSALFAGLATRFEGIRIAGALAYDLACMALGELDGRVSLHAKPVDVAAGAFLVSHVGGCVQTPAGGAFDVRSPGIVAARSEVLLAEMHAAHR